MTSIAIIIVMVSAATFCAADSRLKGIHDRLNTFKLGDQSKYRAAIIEYGRYFQEIAKSYGALYLHPFDLAQFFVRIEKIFEYMEDPQQQEEPIGPIEQSIRCMANEVFLYDTLVSPKNTQLQCALHLIEAGRGSSYEYSQIDASKDEPRLESEHLVQLMGVGKEVYRSTSHGSLCTRLTNASFVFKFKRELIAKILERMSALEEASLRDTYLTVPSSSAANEWEDHMSEVDKILLNVNNELKELNSIFVAMIDKFNENDTPSHREGFAKECRPYDTVFSNPRRALQLLDAKNQIFRPVKAPDYTVDEAFMLQDFETEYGIDVERQFKQLEQVDGDKKEFIVMFNRYAAGGPFYDVKVGKFRETAESAPADSLLILVEDVNRYASQRFEFYHEAKVMFGTKELLAELRPEKYLEAAIAVLKNKKDQQLPFKLFGSNRLTELIVIIEKNKAEMWEEAKKEKRKTPSISAYYIIFEQILFVVDTIDWPDLNVKTDIPDYGRLFQSSLAYEKQTLLKPLSKAGNYLTICESNMLRFAMQVEQISSLAAFSKSVNDLSGGAFNRKAHFDDHLNAAKYKLVHILLSGGVFVPSHLGTEYPWHEIDRLFSYFNSDLLRKDRLSQAQERVILSIGAWERLVSPYPEEITDAWPKTRKLIIEKANSPFVNFEAYVQEEIFKMYEKIMNTMRAKTSEPKRLANTILCAWTFNVGDNNVIEKELRPHLNGFEEQLKVFKQTSMTKLKSNQTHNHGSAEKEMESYIALTIAKVRKIALMIFTEFMQRDQHLSHEPDSALIKDCERFLAIISTDRMPRFEKDILRYRRNNQAKTKLAQVPHAYIPVVAPILLGQSTRSEETIKNLKDLALNQLKDSISRMKSTFPIVYSLKTFFSKSDETALKAITNLTFAGDGQHCRDKFIKEINDIAGNRIENHIEKADAEIQSTLPKS